MNTRIHRSARRRDRIIRVLGSSVALFLLTLPIRPVAAAPAGDVVAASDRFVAAQNAHDVKAVESLLLGAPEFLWITRHADMGTGGGARALLPRFMRAPGGSSQTLPA